MGEIPNRINWDRECNDRFMPDGQVKCGLCPNCDKPTYAWWYKRAYTDSAYDNEISLLVCCDCGEMIMYDDEDDYDERPEDDY